MSGGARDDALVEDVPALVGERLECCLGDLLDGPRRVLGDDDLVAPVRVVRERR